MENPPLAGALRPKIMSCLGGGGRTPPHYTTDQTNAQDFEDENQARIPDRQCNGNSRSLNTPGLRSRFSRMLKKTSNGQPKEVSMRSGNFGCSQSSSTPAV
jgi:hypothetical protein